jgi:hypothetical protein
MKLPAMLSVVLMLFVGLATPANAQTQGFEVNVTVTAPTGVVTGSPSDNFLSFSGPIGIPGVGLPPGTYIFRLIAPSVMQVVSENRSTAYATFFVLPAWRVEATDKYSVTLCRVRGDAPPRITTMFRPDSLTGYEVPYPKVIAPRLIAMR